MKLYKKQVYKYSLVKEEYIGVSAKISNSSDIVKYVREHIEWKTMEIQESFYVLFLNRANNIISFEEMFRGGIFSTTVDIKLIAKKTIDLLASSIICVHNHPSGNLNPSKSDIDICERIKNILNIVDSDMLDNIIITKESYYSFADEGRL